MKTLVQYNNFSFFSFGTGVETKSDEVSFKIETENLDYTHGSYLRNCGENLAEERTWSVTFFIKKQNVPKSYRARLMNKMRREFSSSGTLWAAENDNLFYTEALVESYQIEKIKDGQKVSVTLIQSYPFWTIADGDRTLINTSSSICEALACETEANRCLCSTGCFCLKLGVADVSCGCCRRCPEGQPLCSFARGEIEKLFEECFTFPIIAYDCQACGDYSGMKIQRRLSQDNIVLKIDAPTQIASPINWAMLGSFENVIFRLNKNTIKIPGKYEGVLEYKGGIIYHNGQRLTLDKIYVELPNRRTQYMLPGQNSLRIDNLDLRSQFSIILDWDDITY